MSGPDATPAEGLSREFIVVCGEDGADGDAEGRAAACAADGGELVELGVGGPEIDVYGANHPAPGWSP